VSQRLNTHLHSGICIYNYSLWIFRRSPLH